MFLLDTDHLTFLEHGRGVEADHLRARLAEVDDADVAVSIISFEEQTRGWLAYHGLGPSRSRSKLTRV